MASTRESGDDGQAKAATELIQLQKQTEKARLLLGRLQAGLVDAGNKLGDEATLLVEANQQLVISSLHAQAHAETAARSAELDVLTELPNRLLLLDRCAQAIAVAKRRGTYLALLFLDINDFKQINDTFGHGVGDKVLQHVAHCLKAVVRQADTVSRHGGDEFLILLTEISKTSDAMLIADKIHAALISPFHVDDKVLSLTASIGIGLYPEHGEDADALIEHADLAMYHAKRNGLGSCVFDELIVNGNAGSEDSPPSATSPSLLASRDQNDRHTFLREANERLILAALGAQELQAAAEHARRRQSELLTILAHELRNPLAPIRIAATLLEHVGTDALQLRELQLLINRQVTRMARLLDDLFDVARLNNAGKLTIKAEKFDINALIHEVADTYTRQIQKRRQKFIVQMPMGKILMKGDPGRLTQVFSNLLDNATKYTPEGGEIKWAGVINDATLELTFSDNGIGITATALPHVFEPFMQDAAAISFNNEGLGIGLTVVRELVEAHGGTVTACSAGSGLGSQFVVHLPLLETATRH